MEYDKAARKIDPQLVGTWPSRAQLHRWLSGNLKGLPYPDHCRILEAMLPGHTAQQLFEVSGTSSRPDIFQRVAQGLSAPAEEDVEWGPSTKSEPASIPTRLAPTNGDVDPVSRGLGQRLLELQKARRLSDEETLLLAGLSGSVVELSMRVQIDIDGEGWAHVAYEHEVLNLTAKPITRIPRELWFRYTKGSLSITPTSNGGRRVAIQRVHDTPTLVKFACQISPAIQPGESAVLGYESEGGQFLDQLYWRQSVQRFTRHLSVQVRHQAAGTLSHCSALEEHPDGSESFASEDLLWDYEDDDIVMSVTRDYLRPNQSVTLRWDVDRATA
ncbi:hypothetical protein RB614_37495 [Phytohabitans sp. ZYX-F-186]|uniref:Uncharacterized protein n=1 Tax=Phytohabitans maris TaxID=3071409 RepID=A0ABU0ZTT1_9ACTN|nr:hypothetical protein [Phytohabitans sp. ZYX-F-186]MDQ7910206.1 hypothetical protein [Phytohabitans sp. ZYX-F-186]